MANSGHFGSAGRVQPPTRGKHGKQKRTLILEALHAEVLCEHGEPFETKEEAEQAFFRLLVRRSLNVSDKASAMLAKEVLDRLCPTDKATLPTYKVDFGQGSTPVEKINAINDAVASGEVPADVGNTMVNMITAAVKVEETTELMERMARLEEMLAELDKE